LAQYSVQFNTPNYCVDEGVIGGQIEKIVLKFLNDHPEELHWSAFVAVNNALVAAFPASRSEAGTRYCPE
jgi:hypothetical protein